MRVLDIATYFTPSSGTSYPADGVVGRQELRRLYAYPNDLTAPWIRTNFVSSIDGAVAADGVSSGLGTPADKEVFGVLRTLADAILVGAGTVRSENYGGVRLTENEQNHRIDAGLAPVPPVVVVTASASIDPKSRLLTDTEVPPTIITTNSASAESRSALRKAGARVIEVEGTTVATSAVLATLEELGLRRILCEGGPSLFGTLLAEDCVDELCLTTSPNLLAGESGRIAHSNAAVLHRMKRIHVLADDDGTLLTRWVRVHPVGTGENPGTKK